MNSRECLDLVTQTPSFPFVHNFIIIVTVLWPAIIEQALTRTTPFAEKDTEKCMFLTFFFLSRQFHVQNHVWKETPCFRGEGMCRSVSLTNIRYGC